MLAALTIKFIPILSQVCPGSMNRCGHHIRAAILVLE